MIKRLSILFLLILLAVGLTLCVEGKQFKGRKTEVADYNVSGNITPDATGNYFRKGTYNSKPYYRRADGAYFIWWDSEFDEWTVSEGLGELITPYWCKIEDPITGEYGPEGGAEGFITVSAGPQ